jgi:hypothetical protein
VCSICDLRIEFSIDHPLSLSIAVETRRAIDSGLLPEPDVENDDVNGMKLRQNAIDSLKAAQRRLEWTQSQEDLLALPDFFMLMVESRTWGFFHATPSGFDPNCRPAPPNVSADDVKERDAVLVGSELSLREIVTGRLPFQTALEMGVIAIDADDKRFNPIRTAWIRAFPKVGLSRFVCA